jgi:hypothetical protein
LTEHCWTIQQWHPNTSTGCQAEIAAGVAATCTICTRPCCAGSEWITRSSPIAEACRYLRESAQPIGRIALELGFYGQSAFAKVFRKHLGTSSGTHRKTRTEYYNRQLTDVHGNVIHEILA